MSSRPTPFVLASTQHGTLIVNHLDRHEEQGQPFGVGHQLLNHGVFDPLEVENAKVLLNWRRERLGDGVVAIDCGANIGVMTVEWARHMTGWGEVLAFEAQERIYYALAGNICLNNCFNARALHAAVGDVDGHIQIPQPDYRRAGSFGSLELKHRQATEFIGQPISYEKENMASVPALRLDSMALPRVDFIKIDVEGMEAEVLAGADETIRRFRPYMLIEHIKTSRDTIEDRLRAYSYRFLQEPMNLLAMPEEDPNWQRVHAR